MASANGFRKCTVGALGALGLLAVTPSSAAENQPRMDIFDGQWHFSVTPYVWLPTIYNTTTLNPLGISNGVTSKLHSTPDTYLHNLSFAFFLAGEARKGDWSLFTDYLYMKFDHQNSGLHLGFRIGSNNGHRGPIQRDAVLSGEARSQIVCHRRGD